MHACLPYQRLEVCWYTHGHSLLFVLIGDDVKIRSSLEGYLACVKFANFDQDKNVC